MPVLALLGGGYAARRTLRPHARRAVPGADTAAASGARAARRAWRAVSVGVVALVASVAVATHRLDRPARQEAAPADPVAVAVAVQLARDLEAQQQYDAAAPRGARTRSTASAGSRHGRSTAHPARRRATPAVTPVAVRASAPPPTGSPSADEWGIVGAGERLHGE
ncbi:hypothetical protein [Micromonospora sp. A200]|uniref:hypothetical protein n=1 Tax=Micromonospora sp. A200 TaxID=2940568 RepID=UPI002474716A|nr:hypothetical protein [Micromonospora sp. A200]